MDEGILDFVKVSHLAFKKPINAGKPKASVSILWPLKRVLCLEPLEYILGLIHFKVASEAK